MTGALITGTRYEWNAGSVRALRRFLGYSQSVFAAELGVRQQTVSEWETGMYRPRGASATLLTMVARRAGFIHDVPAGDAVGLVGVSGHDVHERAPASYVSGPTMNGPAAPRPVGAIGSAEIRAALPRLPIGRPEVAI